MPDINYKLVSQKEVLSENKKELLFINISYPEFESEKHGELCKNLSEYYKKGAEEFLKFCREKLFKDLKRKENKYKSGIVMNSFVPYLDEKYASVITDISFFDGKKRRTKRIIDNWKTDGKYPLPLRPRDILPLTRKAKRLYTEEICSMIINGQGDFGYTEDAPKKAISHFDERKFYLTPKGVAFYYERGVLFPESDGIPVFVIPYSMLENV